MTRVRRWHRGSAAFAAALSLVALHAHAADSDVQRQLQQREQQQMELRLKMQQQLDRSVQPPQTPGAGLRQGQLDRDQQQRLQMLQGEQLRGNVGPADADRVRRELERQRATNAGNEQLNRFGAERKFDPAAASSQP